MLNEEIKPYNGITPIIFIWRWLGEWPLATSGIPYYIYALVLNVLFTYIYALCMIMPMFLEMNDLEGSTEVIFVGVSEIALMCKIAIFWINRRRIVQFFKDMDRLLILDTDDETECEFIVKGIKKAKNIFYFMEVIFVTAGAMPGITVLFASELALPYRGMYPFEWQNSMKLYWIVYAFQMIGIMIQVNVSAGFDTIPSSIMILLSAYYDALGYNLEKIGHWKSKEKEDKMLRKLAIKYMNITKISMNLQSIFSYIIFTQFFLGGVVLCTTAFQISMVSPREDIINFFSITVYFVAMCCQIYIPCHFGNEMYFKSDQLTSRIYNSNWMMMDRKFNKKVHLLMEFMKRPSELVAGNLFHVRLTTFTSIMNFAYSVYTLLERVQRK